jgi:hypothetical protein
MKTDSLKRDDMNTLDHFEALSVATRVALKRAASRRSAILGEEMVQEIGRDWIMVPSKKGKVQVVCNSVRAFAL